jgi:type I restriction enzyme S subunit
LKLLSARNIQNGFLDFSDVDYVDEAEFARITTRCRPEKGDILLSCSGTIGRASAVRTYEPLSLVRSAALIRPRQDLVRTDYLEAWLLLPWMAALMKRRANASSQANLFQNQIKELPVFVPDVAAQDRFIKRSISVRAARSRFVRREDYLDSLSASLQHRAFGGEL